MTILIALIYGYEDYQEIPMKRLTRKDIEAGLETMPIDTLLLGASQAKTSKLTHKQREFARSIALGETKAGAYRKAYKSKGKPQTQSIEGQRLVKDPAISLQIDAFKVALEAQKYQTPAHLRALAIHKITEKVLDQNCPPAQQLKALELLGKITEVALFTERREVVTVSNPAEMREKLMASIQLALSNSKTIDMEAQSADDLLAELVGNAPMDDDEAGHDEQSMNADDANGTITTGIEEVEGDLEESLGGQASENGDLTDPPDPTSQISALALVSDLHSIPHTQSP
jgi:hypothetical protein